VAKNVFNLYRDLTQMLNKHRVYIKPALFEDALAFASRGLFDHYYGNTEEYRAGKPLPRVAYQVTTAVSSALHPFLREVVWGRDTAKIAAGIVPIGPGTKTATYLELDADGRFALPDGWVHPTSWDTDEAVEDVQVLDDNEVKTTLNSLIAPPDLQHPMLELVQGGVKLHGGSDELRAKYLALPVRATYALSYPPGGGEPEYDDTNSIDTEWPLARHNQLLTRMLAYPALGLRDNVVQQVARDMSERGN
jgi:hypothetical protein